MKVPGRRLRAALLAGAGVGVFVLALALIGVGSPSRPNPRTHTPTASPSATTPVSLTTGRDLQDLGSLEALRAQFNRDAGVPRLVLLLSP